MTIMNNGRINDPEAEVISANIDFYRSIAGKYDEYETCARSGDLQQSLRLDLGRMRRILDRVPGPVRCLDCGGGTGNLSLKMLEMGWEVTVVDVSSDMLVLLEERARAAGFSPTLINSSIEAFLDSTTNRYDLIAFNSVLHHLYSYLEVIDVVADHIRPGGLFYSNFDPVIPRGVLLPNLLESLDTIVAKAFHDQSDFLPGIARRVRKFVHGSNRVHQRAVDSAGDLAEYHAKTGVDDLEIVSLLKEKGMSILDHERWTGGRTWIIRSINSHLHLLETFKILARQPAELELEN